MMVKIVKEFRHILTSIAKVFVLAIFCVLSGVVIVLPLWKWAVSSPKTYTAGILLCLALYLLFILFRFVRHSSPKRILRRFLFLILTLGEIWFFVFSVFEFRRLFAFLSLFIYGALAIFVTAFLKDENKK